MKLPAVAVLGRIRVPTGNTFMGEAVSPTYNFEEMKKKIKMLFYFIFLYKKLVKKADL